MIKLFGGPKRRDALAVDLAGKEVVLASPESVYEACLFVPVVRALLPLCGGLELVLPESLEGFWAKMGAGVRTTIYPEGAGAREIAEILRAGGVLPEVSLVWSDGPVAEAFARIKVRCRAGYEGVGPGRMLTDAVVARDGAGHHQVGYYMDLLRGTGVGGFDPAAFVPPPPPAIGPQPRVALVPGSELGAAFRWPLERYATLGERLHAVHGAELVILSLPGMVNEANALAERLGDRASNFSGRFDLVQLIEALPYCSLLIGNDGSLPLLAGHAGVPAVVIYGPSDPVESAPFGTRHSLLTVKAVCSPCRQRSCLYDHHECMQDITVEQVLRAAASHLVPAG